MSNETKILLDHFNAALPNMVDTWKKWVQRGYEARMAGKPRTYHGRRHRGCYFRGWDKADKEIKIKAVKCIISKKKSWSGDR